MLGRRSKGKTVRAEARRILSGRKACPEAKGCRSSRLVTLVTVLWPFAITLPACAHIPTAGFPRSAVEQGAGRSLEGIQLVEITEPVARQLRLRAPAPMFSDVLGSAKPETEAVRPGDALEVWLWEAPPGSLFGAPATAVDAPAVAKTFTLPEQMVRGDGHIRVPFVGPVEVAGSTVFQIEERIKKQLAGLANDPQVLVRRTRNLSSHVTVVGEVVTSARVPLTPSGERLLDALAAAGGVRAPVEKTTIQVTRDERVYALPLDTIIRDPKQNIPLQPGDVVTALSQPLSLVALGATGKNEEINFEAQGISLAQALARAGGPVDSRADARGVFIFRFEAKDALTWPRQPVVSTPEGKVPVIFQLNLKDPASFFVAQSFPIRDKDVLYISNASLAELQKFLTVVSTTLYPVASFRALTR